MSWTKNKGLARRELCSGCGKLVRRLKPIQTPGGVKMLCASCRRGNPEQPTTEPMAAAKP